jgi:hypothetical protein
MRSPLAIRVLSSMTPLSTVFGWGSDEGETLKVCSRFGSYVHASDWASNLATLSSYELPQLHQQQPPPSYHPPATWATLTRSPTNDQHTLGQTESDSDTQATPSPVHTVCFLMTDGDNIQWLLNNFVTDAAWWNATARGQVPIGWTLSPALIDLSPPTAFYLYQTRTANDYFVAAPSGVGYADPDIYSSADLAAFTNLTTAYMARGDLAILNVIGSSYSATAAATLLSAPGIEALFWYDYSSYSALNGSIQWVNAKPVIGGRFQLWTGVFDDPQQLVHDLSRQAADPTSAAGYSLIPVHVWTNTVADVVAVAEQLAALGGFEILLPDAFVAKIVALVDH